jgi:Glycosyl transferase family 2
MPEPVDVILLAYNRLDYLVRMVDALERHTVWPYRLTVVDNVSGPTTRQWLRDNDDRVHQVIFNARNEHLGGHQRGIKATSSDLFVVSDADLLPYPPNADGCWLTRLVGLAERHRDFGLIASRIDSDSIRTSAFADAPVIDDEIIEARTGVWLNLMRRDALHVPYMSDGITCYALERSGFRVGIAKDVFCTHLGDEDASRHPDYLARKQSATTLGIVYPDYPEVQNIRRPPTLHELALAAPVLSALKQQGLAPSDTVELSAETWPPVAAVESRVEAAVRTSGPANATYAFTKHAPLATGGARAIVLAMPKHDDDLLAQAQARAGELVLALTPSTVPTIAEGWRIADERPGVHPVAQRLARIGSRRRWRRELGYSTSEHVANWRAMMSAASFGDDGLRLYVLRRNTPRPPSATRWDAATPGAHPAHAPPWRPPLRHSNRVAAFATKAIRLARAEWHLRRT